MRRSMTRGITRGMGLLGIGIISAIAGCTATSSDPEIQITFVSFAVTKAAHKAILPKFAEKWQREKGQRITFKQSYGGSGAQTRAVIDGLEADVVHLALGLDVEKIAKAGLIQPGWETELPNRSIVSKSVAAIVTRPGNPKGITRFTDLAKPGVSWITADPKTSGVARWNYLALWNDAIQSGADPAQAQALMARAYQNVPVLTRDAREAMDVFFKQAQGDALMNYENEVLFIETKGFRAPYLLPQYNISIDNPIAVVDRNVDKHGNREVVEAFVQYLFSAEAQVEFAKAGFRPIEPSVAGTPDNLKRFPNVPNLATIQDFKSWSAVQKQFFADGAMFDQIQSQKK
jgi:sulfate/thiosulfate transport system substrate-binding protein